MSSRYTIAADARSIMALNGSRYEDSSRFIDARELSSLRSERLSSIQADRPPFYLREESISTSRRRVAQTISDFDSAFAAAGNRR